MEALAITVRTVNVIILETHVQKLCPLFPVADGHDDVTQCPKLRQLQMLAVGHFRHRSEELGGLAIVAHLYAVNPNTLKK